jgi:hypothetical protein
MTTDRELREEATGLIRDLNAITGITSADQARRLGLHKANVSACINQGRVQNLGWGSIGALLRMYGLEKMGDRLQVRDSEACPVILPGPLDEKAKAGLSAVVARLQHLGLTCWFHAFVVHSKVSGEVETGGVFSANNDERTWASVAFSGGAHGELTHHFETLGCLPDAYRLSISEEQFESWFDSPPHRSELLRFLESSQAY